MAASPQFRRREISDYPMLSESRAVISRLYSPIGKKWPVYSMAIYDWKAFGGD